MRPFLPDVLRQLADTEPGAEAIVVDGERRLTWSEWDWRSNAIARGLVARGVTAGNRVALVLDNRHFIDAAVVQMAVLKVGAVAVPLGARFSSVELERIVGHCGARVIVEPQLPSIPGGGSVTSADELERGYDGNRAPVAAGVAADAELVYSWRAFDPPQADARSHDHLAAVVAGSRSGSRFLHTAPLGTHAGQDGLWLPFAGAGAAVVATELDPARLHALLNEESVTELHLVPALAEVLVASGTLRRADLSAVQRVVLTGAPLPGLLDRLAEACPHASIATRDAGASSVTPPATRRNGLRGGESGTIAPVAFSQEEYLWHEQFLPTTFNLPPLGRSLRGALQVELLERALDEIARRHEALRTSFRLVDGCPVQVIAEAAPMRLPLTDLSDLSPTERDRTLEGLIASTANRPFDLVAGPLFAPRLVRLARDHHLLLIPRHHLVWDDWSVGVFHKELSAIYCDLAAGKPPLLPELPMRFTEFVRGQRRRLSGAAGDDELSFWRRELSGAPFALELPIDNPDATDDVPERLALPVSSELSPALTQDVRAFSRRNRVTVFMTMLSAFGVLLREYTGQDDLHLTSVVANRNRSELEGMLGCFAKKVPLRLRLTGDPTVQALLVRARESLIGALAHQDLPYETVVQAGLGDDAAIHGVTPNSTVMFQSLTAPKHRMELPEVDVSFFDTSQTGQRRLHVGSLTTDWGSGLHLGTFLALFLLEGADTITCTVRGVFHRPSVERLVANLERVTAELVADPSRRISQLNVLSAGEARLLEDWATSSSGAPPRARWNELVLEQARRDPSRTAIVAGDREVTYGELDQATARLARQMREAGVARGACVGLYLEPSADVVIAVLATWRVGAAYVPLDVEDDALPGDAPLDAIVTHSHLARALRAYQATVILVDVAEPTTVDPNPLPSGPVTPSALTGEHPEGVACIVGRHGSSTLRHGVVIEQAALLDLLVALRSVVEPAGHPPEPPTTPGLQSRAPLGVWLPGRPADDGFLLALVALGDGHTLRLGTSGLSDAAAVTSGLRNGILDVVHCRSTAVPGLLAADLRGALDARGPGSDLPAIVVSFIERCDGRLWGELRAIEGARLYCRYGPPEATFAATGSPLAQAPARPNVGRPLPHVGVSILDPRGRPAPIGAAGELCLSGRLAPGYRGDQEALTSISTTSRTSRHFLTGQRARFLPDGHIQLLGPVGGAVPFRGLTIEPAIVEVALAECPGVRDVAVAVREVRPGGLRLLAYVVATDADAPTLAQVRTFLWTRLPGYVWPAALVRVPAIPRLPSGAIDREALNVQHAGLVTDQARDHSASTPEGILLGALWAEAHGVAKVDMSESYGESFLVADVVSRARQCGMRVTGQMVTRNRTLEQLAAAAAAARLRRRAREE